MIRPVHYRAASFLLMLAASAASAVSPRDTGPGHSSLDEGLSTAGDKIAALVEVNTREESHAALKDLLTNGTSSFSRSSPPSSRARSRVNLKQASSGSSQADILKSANDLAHAIREVRLAAEGSTGQARARTPAATSDSSAELKSVNLAPDRFNLVLDRDRKTVRALKGRFAAPPTAGDGGFKGRSRDFVKRHKNLFRIQEVDRELRLRTNWRDRRGDEHARYDLVHQGLRRFGEELLVHGRGGEIYFVNGNYSALTDPLDVSPEIDADTLLDTILVDQGRDHADLYGSPEIEKIIYPTRRRHRVAYQVDLLFDDLTRWIYFVDARTNTILGRIDNTQPIMASGTGLDLNGEQRNFTAWQEQDEYYLIDPQTPPSAEVSDPLNEISGSYIFDLRNSRSITFRFHSTSSSPDTGWDPSGVSAHANTRVVYDYYLDTFGRDSLDNQGMNLISTIHYGDNYANAFWNGTFMTYGDGDGETFGNFAGCLDVVAHEMTHGVIEHTANLIYHNQSGALNESFADIFAAMVDDNDWTLAEDCTILEPGYLRNLSDPHDGLDSQPEHMSEYLNLPDTSNGDNGGVHSNSGIPNRAAYLVSDGLSDHGLGVSIGREKTAHIFYTALSTYLTATSQFLDARIATIQAAEDIHGAESPEATAVALAWDTVGVIEGEIPTSQGGDSSIENVSGADLMVYLYPIDGSHDAPFEPTEFYDLYAQELDEPFTGYNPELDHGPLNIAGSPLYSRPAPFTIDDQLYILYVSLDGNLYLVNPDGTEQRVTNSGNFYSVAASHDGGRVALTTDDPSDNNVYLMDLDDPNTLSTHEIVLPNYSGDSEVGSVVRYADALAFDYTGRRVVFDFLSCIPTEQGSCDNGAGYQYWSIASLNVSSGNFDSPFPNQSPDLDLGFPRFATNSDRYITFDLHDASRFAEEQLVESLIMVYDLDLQQFEEIVDPNAGVNITEVWGVPSISGDDNHLIYQSLDDTNGYGERVALDNFTRVPGLAQRLNTFAVAMPVSHRNASRTIVGELTADSPLLDFGTVVEGAPAPLDLVLTNTGNRTVILSEIQLEEGPYSHNATHNMTLEPNESVTVTVTLDTTLLSGAFDSLITLVNDGDAGDLVITLTAFVNRDFDEDGVLDHLDEDDDADGSPDDEDAFPLDPQESVDTDGDGTGNNADQDDDGDSLTDDWEACLATDPLTVDSDEDGVDDPDEDSDGDGVANLDELLAGDNPCIDDTLPSQQVVGRSSHYAAEPGSSIAIPVDYNVSDGNSSLPGLALRIHFDSSALTWVEFAPILATDFMSHDQQALNDVEDFDQDPQTDQYLTATWDSIAESWPSQLPVELYTIHLDLSSNLDTGLQSVIRFSNAAMVEGYRFESFPITVTSGLNLDVDGDGDVGALTDGLLLLRHLFDFSGSTLTNGVVSETCTRCTADDIALYITQLAPRLDVDLDGDVGALTDGLIILRHLFSFSGPTLTNGVVSPECERCEPADIAAYIDELHP